jgi:hypothetical protein
MLLLLVCRVSCIVALAMGFLFQQQAALSSSSASSSGGSAGGETAKELGDLALFLANVTPSTQRISPIYPTRLGACSTPTRARCPRAFGFRMQDGRIRGVRCVCSLIRER